MSFSNKFALITFLTLLTACNDGLNLNEEEFLKTAQKEKKEKNYKEAAKLYDKFELQFPTSSYLSETTFLRATCLFLAGEYPKAIAAFETFLENYPTDSKRLQAKKMIFFSYYNRLTRYDRDSELLEKAIQVGEELEKFSQKDKKTEKAMQHIKECIIFNQLNIIHFSLDHSPKLWTQALWTASNAIKQNEDHPLSAESYYRIIEILVNQNSEVLIKDAIKVFNKLEETCPSSIWHKKASTLIKRHIEENKFDPGFLDLMFDCYENVNDI